MRKIIMLFCSILLGSCVSAEKQTPLCTEVVSGFFGWGAEQGYLVSPSAAHPLYGYVFGLQTGDDQYRVLCMVPDRPNMSSYGCDHPGDFKKTCESGNKLWFYEYAKVPNQRPMFFPQED